jgi:hypothetical protein
MAKRARQHETTEAKPSLKELLERTQGRWPGEDGLAYQRAIRGEWDRHPFVVLPYVLPG